MSDGREREDGCERVDGAAERAHRERSLDGHLARQCEQGIDGPVVYWIGAYDPREFAEAVDLLSRSTQMARTASIDEALAAIEQSDDAPELFVLAQTRPGEHAPANVERLRRAAPLARVVLLCGSWCEGELRSGAPVDGVYRVYWHQWRPRLAADIERRRDGQSPSWALPLTATEDDRALSSASRTPDSVGMPPKANIGVVSAAREVGEWLVDTCRAMGCDATLRGGGGALSSPSDMLLVDLADIDDAAIACVRGLSQQRARPVIVLAGFPRIEDVARLTHAGAAAVLSKPLSIDELRWQVERTLAESER